ncbi:MAG: hypothetical protein JXA73_07335 [Acidobacteria bacterium]|nr:hypothetical protein [Acidobacteriota bacterium]
MLQDTNRLAEAEPLMRRMVEIFLRVTRTTGYSHPHLHAAWNNHAGVLQAMGHSRNEILDTLRRMAPEFFGN